MNLHQALTLLIPILGVIITGALVPYLKSRYSKEELERAKRLTEIVVNSAEQLFKEIDPNGIKRKDYVNKRLKESNLDLTNKEIEDLREAAVLEVNRIQKSLLK